MVNREKDFLVVVIGIACSFNQQEAELAGVGTGAEVIAGHGVGVVPAQAGWAGRQVVAEGFAGSDHRRAFFHCAVVEHIGGEAMPMDDVRRSCGVGDVDGDGNALAQAQKRARELPVVGKCLDVDAGGDLDAARLDGEGMVGGSLRSLRRSFLCCGLLGGAKHAGGRSHQRVEQRLRGNTAGGSKE
jgi:hypothetical protein